MSPPDDVRDSVQAPDQPPEHHHDHAEEGFFRKYLWSTDHKIIGMQYLFTGMLMALVGGFAVYAFRMQNAFPKLSATPGAVRWPGPALGEHTDAVLAERCGCTPERLKDLRATGVI